MPGIPPVTGIQQKTKQKKFSSLYSIYYVALSNQETFKKFQVHTFLTTKLYRNKLNKTYSGKNLISLFSFF